LVVCPDCKTEVAEAVKSWPVSFAKHGESESAPLCYIGIFECPKCGIRFRSRLETSSKPVETGTVKSIVERIMEVREGLILSLKVLRERIHTLETERSGLMGEIAQLKAVAETRVSSLESEVSQLREEMRSLKELLEGPEQRTD
jgi:hypothetical protein